MRVRVTLDLELLDLDVLRAQAAAVTLEGAEEWEDYRSTGTRQPHEYDILEIVLTGLWNTLTDVDIVDLEDSEVRTL